jgi:hypothetical protein
MDNKIVLAISELSRLEGQAIGMARGMNINTACTGESIYALLVEISEWTGAIRQLLMESQNESTTLDS